MKKLPYNAMENGAYRTAVNVFGGYNHTLRPSDGEWYDMRNLTSRHYPVLSVRDLRMEYADVCEPHAIIGKDKLVWCDGDKVYYGSDTNVIHTLKDDKEPIIVSLGANIVIFPDGVMYNTVAKAKSELSCTVTTEVPFGGIQPCPFTLTLCDADGKDLAGQYIMTTSPPKDWNENWENYYYYNQEYGFILNDKSAIWRIGTFYYPAITISDDPPASAEDGVTWIDTSSDTPVIKKYSGTMGVWVKFSATYFKLSHIELNAYYGYLSEFRAGDTVTLDLSPGGTKNSRFRNGDYTVIKSGKTELTDGETALPDGETEHYIICAGACGVPEELYGSVRRVVPPMDFVIEGDNRLWGCRYGNNRNGDFTNEIYACKVGDPTNWFSYQGVSTDSYAVSVGSDGPFTGAIFYAGCPTFFKERYIHRVGGSVPANYTMYTTKTDGVQAGSGASLCCVRNTLYYKSPTDIMAYTGSYPVPVSAALGAGRYYDAAAGELGGKYYISMREDSGRWRMFVYDTDKGLWHIEDETHAHGFARVSDRLFCMSDDKIFCVDGGTEQDEKPIEWYAQTGVRTLSDVTAKSVSALCIHAVLGEGSSMSVFIEYDSNGKWEPCGNITGERREAAKLPITPRRCDHYALRIEGIGQCQIYSITQEIEEGSDIRWR